jgi:hypothetical protein
MKRERGKVRTRERGGSCHVFVVVVCSCEEITHEELENMVCEVHLGDTRNDLTPAIAKRLPYNH